MKLFNLLFLPVLLLGACANNEQNPLSYTQRLEGKYEGDFSGSNIELVLEHITDSTANGYSLHKGQKSNMSGTVRPAANGFHMELKELGSSPYEGIFNFEIDTNTSVINGTWKPLNNPELTETTYTLKKQ